MEELEIKLGAEKANFVVVNFYFADRFFQWQHQFEFKTDVLQELTKEGILVRTEGLEKLFLGDEELPVSKGAGLVPYSAFDQKKELTVNLTTKKGVESR